MSQELTRAAEHGLTGLMDEADVFTTYTNQMGVSNGAYINFSGNTGKWTVKGQEVDVGTSYAFDVRNAKHGWIAWKNNKPIEELLVPFIPAPGEPAQRALSESELPDKWDGKPKGQRDKETDGWRYVVRVSVRDLEGGPQMDLTLPAEAPWRPILRLLKSYGEQVRMKVDANGNKMIPVVEIGSDSFDGKGGKKYSPTLKIISWKTEAELAEMAGNYDDVAEIEEVEAPKSSAPPKVGKRV